MILPAVDPSKLVGHNADGSPYTGRVTRTGRFLDVLHPDPDQIDIEDIAAGLGYQPRFTGQMSEFYSLADHSILVSFLVPPELALQGLLHDAAEAYVNDIPRPVKPLLRDYKPIEEAIGQAIMVRYGMSLPLAKEVKDADAVAVGIEQFLFLPNTPYWPHIFTALDVDRIFMRISPHIADFDTIGPEPGRRAFLRRFEELYDV